MAIEDFSSAVADLQQLMQLCGGSSSSSCREASIRLRDAQQRQRLQGSAGPNYYAVLGLQQGCSTAEVKAAYRSGRQQQLKEAVLLCPVASWCQP